MQTSQSRNFQKFLSVIKMVQNAGKTVISYLCWMQIGYCIVSKASRTHANQWHSQHWMHCVEFDRKRMQNSLFLTKTNKGLEYSLCVDSVDSLKLLWSTMWDKTQKPKQPSDAYVLRPTILSSADGMWERYVCEWLLITIHTHLNSITLSRDQKLLLVNNCCTYYCVVESNVARFH